MVSAGAAVVLPLANQIKQIRLYALNSWPNPKISIGFTKPEMRFLVRRCRCIDVFFHEWHFFFLLQFSFGRSSKVRTRACEWLEWERACKQTDWAEHEHT